VRRPGPSRLAWLPIPVLLAAIIVLWAADLRGSRDSAYLMMALNLVFSALVSLFIAYLIARSFLVRSTPGLLLLGCGVVIWGSAGAVATAAAGDDANILITIHNSCVWLSALCHLAGVSLSLRSRQTLSPPALWLPAGYMLAAGAVVLVALSTLAGWIPTFFVQGQGGTPLRQFVLFSAIIMFAFTASLLSTTGGRPLSSFTYWYALALTLIVTGLSGVLLQSSRASILGWTGRAAQLLGGLYMLIAAVASVRESRAWGISLEAALRESEERYRTLVETAPDAIVVHRDGRFLYANSAALLLAGAESFEQLACHTVLDFFRPAEHEQAVERTRTAMAGNRLPMREGTLLRLDGQEVAVEFHTAPVDFQGARAVQTIIRDITERKRAEEALRRSEQNLAVELDAAQHLQRISAQLIRADDIETLYEQILDTAVAILHADFASIQMLYPERGTGGELRLLGYRGFNAQAAKFWEWVRPASRSACGVALHTGQRVVVPDVQQCDFMAGSDDLETYLQTGIHAVQTTPLFSRSGVLLGMISTHWREPHEPTASELGTLDVLARQAADLIDRKRAEEALRELNATLESKVAQRTAELEHRTRQLQRLTLELSQAEDRERRRIAALLHEDVQQQIAGAKFHLNLLRSRGKDDPQQATLDKVNELLKEAIGKSRSLSHDLSPAVLHMNDLAEVLRWLAREMGAKHGLTVHVDVLGDAFRQSEALTMFLFRAAQEMLFNVIKHAQVNEAEIRVRRISRCLCLSVADRGCGFDPQDLKESSGFGLRSIRERVALLGGRMKIKSAEGQGSRFHIVVPDGYKIED